MLTEEQARSASDLLLEESRKKQVDLASTIATRYRPLSAFLRYSVTSATGFLVGGIFGDLLRGEFSPWCVVGLIFGIGYGYLLGHMRHRREA